MKIALLLAAFAAVALAAPTRHMVNDKFFVDAINAMPGVLWKAGENTRFDGMSIEDSKSLLGVKPGSWGPGPRSSSLACL